MFRKHLSNGFLVATILSGLSVALLSDRCAIAKPSDIVDLEAKSQDTPPASTTDKSTPVSGKNTPAAKPLSKEAKDAKDAVKQDEAEEKLKARAGERIGTGARGASQVLGMSLQEGLRESVKVVDVAMNSPAHDAGVVKGDEIVAFQGFKGESYRKWIDGIRRLTTDTGAGLKIPVVVARDGKQLTVGIVVPEKPLRPSFPRPLAQPGSPLMQPGVAPALPAPGNTNVAVVNGGNNVAIDANPFGAFFGDSGAGVNESAMAQIVRIGGKAEPTPKESPEVNTGATVAPTKGGARVGMAGFRDEPSGMVVMVDVGALPAGSYAVGISDASVIGGATVVEPGAAAPNPQSPNASAVPQAGEINPATRTTGPEVNPSTRPAAGQLSVGSPQQTTEPSAHENALPRKNSMTTQIGTIVVDQSGTGRLQQKIESLQVRNIVGQAIVLYSQGETPQAVPANDLTGAATRKSVADAPAAPPQAPVSPSGPKEVTVAKPVTDSSAMTEKQVPVAGGIIQLVTDRRPPQAEGPQVSQPPAQPNVSPAPPATATPPSEQNLLR